MRGVQDQELHRVDAGSSYLGRALRIYPSLTRHALTRLEACPDATIAPEAASAYSVPRLEIVLSCAEVGLPGASARFFHILLLLDLYVRESMVSGCEVDGVYDERLGLVGLDRIGEEEAVGDSFDAKHR